MKMLLMLFNVSTSLKKLKREDLKLTTQKCGQFQKYNRNTILSLETLQMCA